jgi:hypothetical protein
MASRRELEPDDTGEEVEALFKAVGQDFNVAEMRHIE